MDLNIVINEKIFNKYKDEILPLNARLFTDKYFYNLKEYKEPYDLVGIEKYITYIDNVNIFTTATFIDFVNILLVISFLKRNNYEGSINIKYFIISKSLKDGLFSTCNLSIDICDKLDYLLRCIKQGIEIKQMVNIKMPGLINYINFYNMLVNRQKLLLNLQEKIDEYEEDIDLLASYLEDKYSNMGIDKKYYKEYLEKYL